MGSTCSVNRSKQPKIQSVDQLSFECDEYGVIGPPSTVEEPIKQSHPVQPPIKSVPPPKSFDPDENDASDTWGWVSPKQFHNYFYEGFYAPFILNPSYMLIVDARSENAFRKAHIVTSHWHGDTSLKEDGSSKVVDLQKYSLIVLCDQDGSADENSTVRRIQHVMCQKAPGSGLEPMIIRGGMDIIEKQFPYMMIGTGVPIEDRLSYIPWYPAMIIDQCLYMGRTEHALNKRVVTTLGITHVVSLSPNTPNIFPFVSYLCVPLPILSTAHNSRESLDDEIGNGSETKTSSTMTLNVRSQFNLVNAEVSKALDSGGKVLIHCDEGLDPSTTVIIAYLMNKKYCTLADAHDYLKSLRPIIQPSESCLTQLSEYEVELYGKKYTNTEDLWY
ncbi:hypothetical protein CHUAL_007539 [Chamberlinius hualienensis]